MRADFNVLIVGFRLAKTLRERRGIHQTLQQQLLGAKVLFQLVSFNVACTELIENAIAGAPQVHRHDESGGKTEDNKNKTQVRHRIQMKD